METVKVSFDTLVHPKKELIASCSVCKTEIRREEWLTLGDHQRKKKHMEKVLATCPFCGAAFKDERKHANIPWERTKDGDYIAKAANGDFLVWKWGYGYKWRYRKYGAESPEGIFWVRTKDAAMKACERHAEWKL